MENKESTRFTLSDDTRVIVKKVTDHKYDFELTLTNGNRKTFRWYDNDANEFADCNGNMMEGFPRQFRGFSTL